jgi:uncharacterized protein (DUF1499 family)
MASADSLNAIINQARESIVTAQLSVIPGAVVVDSQKKIMLAQIDTMAAVMEFIDYLRGEPIKPLTRQDKNVT